MSIFMMGLPIGLFAAYMLSGNIAKAWGWRAAFFIACIPGLILAALALFITRAEARGDRGAAPRRHEGAVSNRTGHRHDLVDHPVGDHVQLQRLRGEHFSDGVPAALPRTRHREAANISAFSLGLAGVLGLLVGGWLGDRLRLPARRLTLAAIGFLRCGAVRVLRPSATERRRRGVRAADGVLDGADVHVLLHGVQRVAGRRAAQLAGHDGVALFLRISMCWAPLSARRSWAH